jgi:hypothetical protein
MFSPSISPIFLSISTGEKKGKDKMAEGKPPRFCQCLRREKLLLISLICRLFSLTLLLCPSAADGVACIPIKPSEKGGGRMKWSGDFTSSDVSRTNQPPQKHQKSHENDVFFCNKNIKMFPL